MPAGPGVAVRRSAERAGTRRAVTPRLSIIALLVSLAQPAAAHIPPLRGRLIELVSQSDLIVAGTVEDVAPLAGRDSDTTVRVEARLLGESANPGLTFRAHSRFAPGQRFVFFLRHRDGGIECVQLSGTVFPARPEDDAAYREVVTGIARALRLGEGEREAALAAALIPALTAASPPLRYHAVLELAALAHHGLTTAEQHALAHLMADPAADPAIRPIVTEILRTSDGGAVTRSAAP